MATEAARYEHLLKPIKDLTEEWGIECAKELEDYLEELQDLTIAFDGEERSEVDFAQAALIIQNSTKVYGKQVENLSQLVLSALDTLKKKAAARYRQHAADLGDEVDEFGDEEELLVLDLDAILEGRRIDMAGIDEDTAAEGMDMLRRRTFDAAAVALMVDDSDSLALQGTSVHPSGMIAMNDGLDVREVTMDLEVDGGGGFGGFDVDEEEKGGAAVEHVPAGTADVTMGGGGIGAAAEGMADPVDGYDSDGVHHEPDYPDYVEHMGDMPEVEEEEEEEDPWAPLDPHDADDADERVPRPRPFRKGKTWSKPRASSHAASSVPGSALADPVLLGLPEDSLCSSSSSSSAAAAAGGEGAHWWGAAAVASLTAAHFAPGGVSRLEFSQMGERFVAGERASRHKEAAARRQQQRLLAASQAASATQRHRASQSEIDDDSDGDNEPNDFDYDSDSEPWPTPDGSQDPPPLLLGLSGEDTAACSYEGLASKMLEKMKREAEA
jgi:hypothetical protein